jgi:hypothetical protein
LSEQDILKLIEKYTPYSLDDVENALANNFSFISEAEVKKEKNRWRRKFEEKVKLCEPNTGIFS